LELSSPFFSSESDAASDVERFCRFLTAAVSASELPNLSEFSDLSDFSVLSDLSDLSDLADLSDVLDFPDSLDLAELRLPLRTGIAISSEDWARTEGTLVTSTAAIDTRHARRP
jgi:hypothetical protein